MFTALLIKIDNSVGQPIFAHGDASDHAVVANLRAVRQCIGYMSDERRWVRTHFAALDTKAAIDAMRAVAV